MRSAASLVCVLTLSAGLLAHGGQYRGRQPSAAPRLQPGIPPGMTPAPGPGVPGVTPGSSAPVETSAVAHWSLWWEFNKDPFLQSRGVVQQGAPVTGSDDFYLGVRRAADRIDTLLTTDEDRQARIAPALAALLGRERHRDVQGATLIALGKVGRDAGDVPLEPLLAQAIARDDQEVRESAVLALGLAGRPEAKSMLVSLLRDGEVGRKLEGREHVADRTRAFAAYALGLLAMRSKDSALLADVQTNLLEVLAAPGEKDRDVRTAALSALGVLRLDAAVPAQKLLLWRTVEALLQLHAQDLGAGDELIQAHAAVAIGRLLGRGGSQLHQRCKQAFADELSARKRRGNAILQSSALALGMLTRADAEDAPFVTALQRYYDDGHDRVARYFGVIALGRIGGEDNRSWLLRAYDRGNKATDRPWLALALGLWCAGAEEATRRDETIVRRLLEDLADSASRDTQSALAVAVGLTGHPAAGAALTKLLKESEADEFAAGYLAIGLALVGDRSAVATLAPILERSERRPFLLQQTAIALGVLGDRQAVDRLVDKLKRAESVAVLAAIAKAIGQIGDRRAIGPLIETLGDAEAPKLTLAFAAAALGGVGDKDLLPWNLRLSVDANYATGIDTLTNGATGILDIL
ncbi:MAG: hypothetical protein RL398_1491 [Planctomycetota bacterium]